MHAATMVTGKVKINMYSIIIRTIFIVFKKFSNIVSLLNNFMNNSSQLRWWIIVCFQILILSLGVFFGIWTHIWEVDVTRISFIIISIWLVATVFIARCHLTSSVTRKQFIPVGWFLAETCLALGMIGTVAGFLIMMISAFTDINIGDTASMQTALASMALGMGTALYTTLVGLVSSLFIKSQLVNLENQT